MNRTFSLIIGSLLVLGVLVVIFTQINRRNPQADLFLENPSQATDSRDDDEAGQAATGVDFASYSPDYRFAAMIDPAWQVEYVAGSDSINIFDAQANGSGNLDKSVIFIRKFSANEFLTLNTVDILDRVEGSVNGHASVSYEIQKKSGVPDFPDQPAWRNDRHRLTDVRYAQTSPSLFYVFAYNPNLPSTQFSTFVNSLQFHNDQQYYVMPTTEPEKRITKKEFGTQVSPNNSPVSPERFSGFHTGLDFEILSGEENIDVGVRAVCGGPLLRKQTASGYGGLAVQQCQLNDQVIAVVYGHIRLSSVAQKVGDYVTAGQTLAVMGSSPAETDGERKHLHLSFRKGSQVNLAGYVPRQSQLNDWLDPAEIIGL